VAVVVVTAEEIGTETMIAADMAEVRATASHVGKLVPVIGDK
jgi:hypothetical protein